MPNKGRTKGLRRVLMALALAIAGAAMSAPPAAADIVVREVQRLLAAEGYDPGAIDGVAGPATKHAVAAFQRDRGLPATGRLDRRTVALLRAIHYGRDAPAPPPSLRSAPPAKPSGTAAPSALKPATEMVETAAGFRPLGDQATVGSPRGSISKKEPVPVPIAASVVVSAPAASLSAPVSADLPAPLRAGSHPLRGGAAPALALGAVASLSLVVGMLRARRRRPARLRGMAMPDRSSSPSSIPFSAARTPGEPSDDDLAYRRWLVRGVHTPPASPAFLDRYLAEIEARYFDGASEAERDRAVAEARALLAAQARNAAFAARVERFLTAVEVERVLR